MSMNLKVRRHVEAKITRTVLRSVLKAGFEAEIELDEPEGFTTDFDKLFALCMDLDEARIYVRVPGSKQLRGWIYLIYGNDGYDLVSDYTTNLEEVLTPAHKQADRFEELYA